MKAAFVAIMLAGSVAYAQPKQPDKVTRARAALMYEEGSAAYEAGRFSEAIPLFKQAYELVHDPVYLFNLAQSYRKVLDCVAATEYYERFLAEAGAKDTDPKQRERVQGWVRELQPCVDERKRDAEAARKGQEAAAAAERARLEEVQRRRNDRSDAGYTTVDNGKWLRVGGYVLAGLGGVGIALGISYGVKGGNLEAELATECKNGCDWTRQDLRDKDKAGKRANTLSTVSWIGGGVALAGGVALYIIGRSRTERVQVTPVEGGAAVTARVSF